MTDVFKIGETWKFREKDGRVTTGIIVNISDIAILVKSIFNEEIPVVKSQIERLQKVDAGEIRG